MAAIQHTIRVQKCITLLGVLLLLIKFSAYYLTYSVAILTDALESIVNVVAGFIGWYCLVVAAKPKDADHPYGHGKAEFLSAAVEGTLIILAGVYIIIQSILHLIYPPKVALLDYGIALIALSGILNFAAGVYAIKTGKKNNSVAITASGKHLKNDAYSTLALLVGLAILLYSKIWWVDSAVAMVMAVFILYAGYTILRQSVSGIMDEADTKLLHKLVVALNLKRSANWIDLHNLRIIKYGSQLHVDCHLTLPWYFNVTEAHTEIELLSVVIKQHFGAALETFVHTDSCQPFSCQICQKQNCMPRQFPFEKKVEWTLQNIIKDQKHSIQSSTHFQAVKK